MVDKAMVEGDVPVPVAAGLEELDEETDAAGVRRRPVKRAKVGGEP